MIRSIFLSFLLFSTMASMAQRPPETTSIQQKWQQIDSLVQKGRPESAAAIARKILTEAQKEGLAPHAIKAQLFLMGADERIQENSTIRNIQRIDSIIRISEGAEKAIWQSINAELYWQYYQRNRWTILGRTPIAGAPPADISVWDAGTFIAKASDLYQASILDSEPLKAIPIAQYVPLIAEGENTRHLRPTLYDFLAFRAIAFFENEEKDITQPAYQFQIDGTLWFEPVDRFAEVKVNPAQPASLHFRALHTYQQVLDFHRHDEQPDALIDADLHRLAFVHRYSVHPQKDSLYLRALTLLEQRYPNNPAAAQASFSIIQWLYNNRLRHTEETTDLRVLNRRLGTLIARFPGSEGAVNATRLRHELTTPSLSLQTEEVVLPAENSKALITYRNLDKVYFNLYSITPPIDANQRQLSDAEQAEIRQKQPLRSWEQALPAAADHDEHRAELKIEPLPAGSYVLVASATPISQTSKNIVHAAPFQVSSLSAVTNTGADGNWLFALHRKSGMPLHGAKVVYWTSNWNNERKAYQHTKLGETTTDDTGKAAIPDAGTKQAAPYGASHTRVTGISLIHHADSLQLPGYYHFTRDNNKQPENREHAFFFTDRSIYRPGQSIYFKGILVAYNTAKKISNVLPNKQAKVTLYDVNGQEVTTLDVTTNDYGSFSGHFTAPEHGLTGQMRLGNDQGSAYFAVEEYKRPRFKVSFDTLKTGIALNQEVMVSGKAQAYAGNAVSGAEVRYRVVRRARFPYFWTFYRWGQPHSPDMEIASGTSTTDAEGTFDVAFTTIPDKQLNPETFPVFTYTVYADVTDINGETQRSSIGVNAGYRSLQLTASIDEQLDLHQQQQLHIHTQNLNGIPAPAEVAIAVRPLRFPGKLYRKRLWEKPDQHLMSEAEFRAAFPDDEYNDEADYLQWAPGDTLWSASLNTEKTNMVELPAKIWKQEGWHVIELTTSDPLGNAITEKKYIYAVDTGKQARTQANLLVFSNKTSLKPGESLRIAVKTGSDSTYVLETGTDTAPAITAFSTSRLIDRRISEKDRGGIAFSWLYVYNNRVYTASQQIMVPWSDRDLHLEWATHRDKLLPGEAEEWHLTIKGDKKEQVAAELLAGLYDASLDALNHHQWHWNTLRETTFLTSYWNTSSGFGQSLGSSWQNDLQAPLPDGYTKRYDELDGLARSIYPGGRMALRGMAGAFEMAAAPALQSKAADGVAVEEVAAAGQEHTIGYSDSIPGEASPSPQAEAIPLRANLQETAFFFPHLQTDAEGNVSFKFTMPEALTEWKLMAFAHTADWKTGYLEGKVKTQKDLMVMPNLPRFVRQGDAVRISAKISNVSAADLKGTASLVLLDATTFEPITGLSDTIPPKDFVVNANQSSTADWMLHIPADLFNPIVVRVTAKAGNFTDGEEHTLPVLTNRMLVTETLPLPIRGNESRTFELEKLQQPASDTHTNHALTVEFTGNPAWYAIQALPYLMDYPLECAEQVFNRLYANALAAHIVAQAPRVKAIFDQWKGSDTTALLSNLEKNQELKSALLEETPWVMEAKDEGEQKRRIAQLFDSHQLAQGLQQNAVKLADMQLPDGSFPWFRGMQSDRYITQYIATGIARLRHLGIAAAQSEVVDGILTRAVGFLDRQLKANYDTLLAKKANLESQHIAPIHIQQLYLRSLLSDLAIPTESQAAYGYYASQAVTYWPQFNPYLKGQVALVLSRRDNAGAAAEIITSLRETAINHPELGMYWKSMPRGYWWHEAPIEAQALLIEAFGEVDRDTKTVDDLKVWLLKQKQTQHWNTTKATADAIYALLLQGSDWLVNEPAVTIALGKETIRTADVNTETGTGYFKKRFDGDAITPDMGKITATVNKATNEGVAWGAVYWQYFEDLDKISATANAQEAGTPLSLRKQLFIERNTAHGPVLEEINETNMLRVGDKVNVRIELRVDRDMAYVHLKDMRAACFEPANVLSGHRYQAGLGYYESTRDVATNFFFDYLRKGTYVFEYPVVVSQAGDFSNGVSTIQCLYAPEFGSHSAGIRVQVTGE
ncbi:hypothetical protein JHJ32_02010 [Parapedobacter sp. ISTM3]|uniref:alpha-2-macroglobulin family protein n=1 Tax=Parapedobacter sp. ISTM3 TaxID=2800130 RepID=UPI00190459D3|nr:alpha-2-macroglobulin family protein [Parapedobacter sp. ISTM3]MBK1438748.1 hypothetical protein [Parapedobacter sp. ISTM3]